MKFQLLGLRKLEVGEKGLPWADRHPALAAPAVPRSSLEKKLIPCPGGQVAFEQLPAGTHECQTAPSDVYLESAPDAPQRFIYASHRPDGARRRSTVKQQHQSGEAES